MDFENLNDVVITPQETFVQTQQTADTSSTLAQNIPEQETKEVFARVMPKPISVYVKRNEKDQVIEVNSDVFLDNFDGWEKIDEGYGDKFAHAQNQYFNKPLIDEDGNYQVYLVKE